MLPLRPDGPKAARQATAATASSAPLARRVVSQVPLPSYAQPPPVPAPPRGGGLSSRLMSLNSAILAAQQEWERKNRGDGRSLSGSSSVSSSGVSSVTNESGPEPTREPRSNHSSGVIGLMGRPAPPVARRKRSIDSPTLEASLRPTKRVFSNSLGTSSDTFSSSLRASQSGTSSLARRHTQDGGNRRVGDSERLLFSLSDSIPCRADGSEYEYYHAPKGRLETLSGTLIPTNYKVDTFSQCPFVCPDKACQKQFDSARALGGHFSAGHKGTAYNDNCDGTFTKVGSYNRVMGSKWRAIVVSRISVKDGCEEEDPFVTKAQVQYTPAHVALTWPDPFTYVRSFLPQQKSYSAFLSIPYILELCELPKRRQLPPSWISFHRNKDLSERMFALAVAYITGIEMLGPDVCDAAAHETGSRLSFQSVAVPFVLSQTHMKKHFPVESCVGCYYAAEASGQPPRCPWMTRSGDFILRYYENVDGVEDHDDDYGVYALRGAELELALQRQSARAVQAVIDAGRAAELKMPSPSAPAGRSHDLPAEQESSEDSSSAYDDDGFLCGQSRTYGGRASAGDAPRRVTVAELAEAYSFADPDRRSRSATTLRKTKQSTPPEPTTRPKNSVQAPLPQLEMESWEVAPGRMVDSTHGENIGYSNAYLNGREPVQVSEDVSFNVLTIKPGDKARWEAHESQLRTCSVASGKIEIKIGANKFGTGPNSVFIIRPGETCVATNKLYVDATVHCTTVKNYSLLT